MKYVGQIAAAYAARNGTTVQDLPVVIKAIHAGLQTAGVPAEVPPEKPSDRQRPDRKKQRR